MGVLSGQRFVVVAAPNERATEQPQIVAMPAHGRLGQPLVQQVQQERCERLDDLLTHGDVSRLDPPLGHELEIAERLRFIKRERVRNTVWITADVHYCAAHYYDPQRAAFNDFDGFWEFVAGLLNAGSFGPNTIDGSFGPQVVFAKAPPPGQVNLSPMPACSSSAKSTLTVAVVG